VTAWPSVLWRCRVHEFRRALRTSPVVHSYAISLDHAGQTSPTIEHVGLKQAVCDVYWFPNGRLLTKMMQSRTSDLFDSLVQRITALPSRLAGLKKTPESVHGDDIWPVAISRRAFRTMRIAQVTTPLVRFARQPSYRVLGAPIRSDWKRRDRARGDRTMPRAVVSFGCPVYVVAVPGVGPVDPSNSPFFDVVIGFDDKQRHI